MASEVIIDEGHDSSVVTGATDPVIRFPIPNERDLRKAKRSSATFAGDIRSINFTGDGSHVRFATELPFKPPGLQWNGGPAITTRQLQQQSQERVHKKTCSDKSSAV